MKPIQLPASCQRYDYEQSLKIYRDLKGVIDTAFDEGQVKKTIEIAKKLLTMGMSTDQIREATGLDEHEINKLND